jgi:Flp pilus assembly pilin Flp
LLWLSLVELTSPLVITLSVFLLEDTMVNLVSRMWSNDEGQDIAEYAVMLAVILVIVIGTIKVIGTQANTVFSQTASALQ